jgi:hypothetical protein
MIFKTMLLAALLCPAAATAMDARVCVALADVAKSIETAHQVGVPIATPFDDARVLPDQSSRTLAQTMVLEFYRHPIYADKAQRDALIGQDMQEVYMACMTFTPGN